jgi:hypothetical protein
MIGKAIAILERAGFKLTPPDSAGEIHSPQSAERGGGHKTAMTRAYITNPKGKPAERAIEYLVYVSKEGDSDAKPSPQRFSTSDEAARACISLNALGYKILGVSLPGGNYVTAPQIQRSIMMGVSSVRIALAS